MSEQKKAPIFSESYTISGTKIVLIFAGVFTFMKIFAIFSSGLWIIPNLLVALPAVLMGIIAIYLLKTNQTNWWFIVIAFIVFVSVRINEAEWVIWLNNNL